MRPAARVLLETVAIVPPPVDLALVDALVPECGDELDECLTAGVLQTTRR